VRTSANLHVEARVLGIAAQIVESLVPSKAYPLAVPEDALRPPPVKLNPALAVSRHRTSVFPVSVSRFIRSR
jgi:hypothetical protein